jgi:hypothetical protein
MPALAVNGSSQDVRHVILVRLMAFCVLVALGIRDFVRGERS